MTNTVPSGPGSNDWRVTSLYPKLFFSASVCGKYNVISIIYTRLFGFKWLIIIIIIINK